MKKRSVVIAVIAFIVLIAGVVTAYAVFKEKPEKTQGTETVEITNEIGEPEIITLGAKNVIMTVIDNNGDAKEYEIKTDTLYLNEAMEEAGITYDADGTYVNAVNGITADYNVDQSYWSFEVNGQYCNYGIFEQPVNDGDSFKIAYTIYEG